MRLQAFLATIGIGLWGCSTSIVIDPSIPAAEAGDYTLAISACEATPGGGMDICRVTESTQIASVWRLYPPQGMEIVSGEVDAYYRDIHKTYDIPAKAKVLEIPWQDFFSADTWGPAQDGEVMALVLIRYKTPEGIEEIAQFRGLAKIVVTKPGYARLPIDSSSAAWKTNCQIVYSTAGRSAVNCQ